MTRQRRLLLSLFGLTSFAVYFTYPLFALQRFLNHPEYVNYYHTFRQWFLAQILGGQLPQWNPFWGIGDTAQIEASFPLDLFSPLEVFFGPHYHLFQPIQLLTLLLAGFWALRKLHIHSFVAVPALIFFVSSPWTSYFFPYYLKPISFLAFLLAFPLTFLWFRSGKLSALIAMVWVAALSMPGTKLEYWFYFYVTIFCTGIACHFAWPNRDRTLRRKRLTFFIGGLTIALLANSWQWVPLIQVLANTNRLESPLGWSLFLSSDFYQKFWLGLRSSELISLGLVTTPALIAFRVKNRQRYLFAAAALLLGVILKPYNYPAWSYLSGFFGMGAACGLLLVIIQKQFRLSTLLFFFLLALYWCRLPPGDLREVLVIQTAPGLFRAITGAMVMLAASAVSFTRIGRICFTVWICIHLLRDQGQTFLAFFNGFMWIPSRDTFILEYLLALMGAVGFQRMIRSKVLIPALSLAVSILLSTAQDPFYSQPLMKQNQGEFPRYRGEENLIETLGTLPDPTSRVYLLEPEAMLSLKALGASLSAQRNQVTNFSSLLSSRFHDWTVLHTFGYTPADQWSAHEAEYTAETLAKLPVRNTLGHPNDLVYRNTLYSQPPPNVESLRTLGVTHIVQPNPPVLLEGMTDYKFGRHYTVAKLKGTLPRAFSIPKLAADAEKRFRETLDSSYETKTLHLGTSSYVVNPIQISDYQAEKVSLIADVKEDSIVVLTDAFHPFWKVKIDGMFSPIFPGLGIFRAVSIPKGRHEIVFQCEIPFWGAAIGLSVAAFILIIFSTLICPFLGLRRRPIRLFGRLVATP